MILVITFLALGTIAAPAKKTASTKKISTHVDFDDRLVGGKYQYSTEAITKVEDDKSLEDLIGVRKNFKDRIDQYKDLR